MGEVKKGRAFLYCGGKRVLKRMIGKYSGKKEKTPAVHLLPQEEGIVLKSHQEENVSGIFGGGRDTVRSPSAFLLMTEQALIQGKEC